MWLLPQQTLRWSWRHCPLPGFLYLDHIILLLRVGFDPFGGGGFSHFVGCSGGGLPGGPFFISFFFELAFGPLGGGPGGGRGVTTTFALIGLVTCLLLLLLVLFFFEILPDMMVWLYSLV